MKADVGPCQCRRQSLIEDARKEKEASSLMALEAEETNFGDLDPDTPITLNLMVAVRHPSTPSLHTVLKILERYDASVYHMETRPAVRCQRKAEDMECLVRCSVPGASVHSLITSMKKVSGDVKMVKEDKSPAFPKKVQDLDKCQRFIVKFEPHFNRDHPGYGDQEYKKRRAHFAELALTYRDGDTLPSVEYTAEESAIWKQVYKSLTALYPNHACKQYLDVFQELEKNCGFSENSIPQLQNVSNFLKEKTGFRLRPAAGLLSARDFLACLAFRVFPTTQYLRHSSAVMHSPEPDCCHELLGHIPMLADKEFAQFSQDIGMASLGASDEEIEKLATLYWFTIEFGLCKQNGSIKAYGAGLLSSYGELMYALSNKPELLPFDPEVTAVQPYEDNCFQPVYFVSENFEESKAKLQLYILKMKKPFSLRYDPLTCSIEVIDSIQQILKTLCQMKDDLHFLYSALDKIS